MENDFYKLELVASEACLWQYTVKVTNETFTITPPRFEVEGEVTAAPDVVGLAQHPVKLANGVTEFRYNAGVASNEKLQVALVFRTTTTGTVPTRTALRSAPTATLSNSGAI